MYSTINNLYFKLYYQKWIKIKNYQTIIDNHKLKIVYSITCCRLYINTNNTLYVISNDRSSQHELNTYTLHKILKYIIIIRMYRCTREPVIFAVQLHARGDDNTLVIKWQYHRRTAFSDVGPVVQKSSRLHIYKLVIEVLVVTW